MAGPKRRRLSPAPAGHGPDERGIAEPPGRVGPPPGTRPVIVDHDGWMGSDGSKPRKRRHKLGKVPKYEEPNRAEGFSGGSFGRAGHGSDGHHAGTPGRAGSYLLKVLGRKPKGS